MALTTVNITGTFNFPDATWSQYTKAEFHLSGYDTDTEVVVPKVTTVALGALGELDVDLWGNDDGLRGTVYRVNVVVYEDSGYSREVLRRDLGRIQIVGDGPVDIATLLDSPPVVPMSWYSVITQAEYDAAIQAVADAEEFALQAEAFGNPEFNTIAIMAAFDGFVDGQYVGVYSGYNGHIETFIYDAASTATADGALIVVAAAGGRLISTRKTLATVSGLLTGDLRGYETYTAGDIVEAGGFRYEVALAVVADNPIETAGGVKLYAIASATVQPEQFGHPGDTSVDALPYLDKASALAVSAGATLVLSAAYAVSAAWVWPEGLVVGGAGTISTRAGFNDNIIRCGDYGEGRGFRVVIPDGVNFDAVLLDKTGGDSVVALRGVTLKNLTISGGNSATHFALAITDSFRTSISDIDIRTSMNGVKVANIDSIFNYGNSTFSRVEVSMAAAGRIGWDIYGVAGTKNYNLMSFDYISAVTGLATGSTGIRIRNCSYMTFTNVDSEGAAISLDITGGVSGGAAAFSNVFTNGYFSDDVVVGSGAQKTTFVGGRVFGTVTDVGVSTLFLNFSDTSSTTVPVSLTNPVLTAPTVVGFVKTGPRFTPSGLTIDLRNQSGVTALKGTVVRIGGVDFGYQTASETLATWAGVVIEDTAVSTTGDVCVSGIVQIRATTAVTRGDYLKLGDGGNAGQVVTLGAVAPTGAEVLVGIAVETTGAAGLVHALLKQA